MPTSPAAAAAASASVPIYIYNSGPVTISIYSVDSVNNGFSYSIAVNGIIVLTDNVYASDDAYTEIIGNYAINYTPGPNSLYAEFFVYPATSAFNVDPLNPSSFNILWNGTQA